jgi:hypothetical protein
MSAIPMAEQLEFHIQWLERKGRTPAAIVCNWTGWVKISDLTEKTESGYAEVSGLPVFVDTFDCNPEPRVVVTERAAPLSKVP